MHLPIPWGLVAIFISLSAFYYFNQKSKIRRQNKREKVNEKRQEILDLLKKKSKR